MIRVMNYFDNNANLNITFWITDNVESLKHATKEDYKFYRKLLKYTKNKPKLDKEVKRNISELEYQYNNIISNEEYETKYKSQIMREYYN